MPSTLHEARLSLPSGQCLIQYNHLLLRKAGAASRNTCQRKDATRITCGRWTQNRQPHLLQRHLLQRHLLQRHFLQRHSSRGTSSRGTSSRGTSCRGTSCRGTSFRGTSPRGQKNPVLSDPAGCFNSSDHRLDPDRCRLPAHPPAIRCAAARHGAHAASLRHRQPNNISLDYPITDLDSQAHPHTHHHADAQSNRNLARDPHPAGSTNADTRLTDQ